MFFCISNGPVAFGVRGKIEQYNVCDLEKGIVKNGMKQDYSLLRDSSKIYPMRADTQG